YRALESMRLEMAFRLWSADMSPQYTPLEAGMERFVRLDKDFVGRDALKRQAEAGVDVLLSAIAIDVGDADPHGFEPVYHGERIVGTLDAGGYGHTMDVGLALAYLPVALAEPGTELAVEILGERRAAVVCEQPPIRHPVRFGGV